MHLGKKHEFSTLRHSLGSILAEANGQPTIEEEQQLTRWMHPHLRIIPIPFADVDTLDHLESEILTKLGPPLKLARVPETPLRRQICAPEEVRGKAAGDVGDRRSLKRCGDG